MQWWVEAWQREGCEARSSKERDWKQKEKRELASSKCGTKRVLLCQICVFDHGRSALDPWFSKLTLLAVGKDLKQL